MAFSHKGPFSSMNIDKIKQIIEKAEKFPEDYVPVSVIQIFEHVTPEKIRKGYM